MNEIKDGWFSEIQNQLWPGQAFSLRIKKVLHQETSPYQEINILETETFGRCLTLDGIIQCTTRDEFAYQEMISFLPLCSHPDPKKVLIVGGGDGGVAREVVKLSCVQEVHQIEIDERVIEVSKKYLQDMSHSFSNEKVNLTIGDGFEYLKQHENVFDVVITDSSDPIGPALSLFQEKYFALLKNALRYDGIMCSQAGSFWLDINYIKSTMETCKKYFPQVAYAVTSVPSYPCGHIGFMIGSLNAAANLKIPARVFDSGELDIMNVRYYSNEIHSAAFTLPRWVSKRLYGF